MGVVFLFSKGRASFQYIYSRKDFIEMYFIENSLYIGSFNVIMTVTIVLKAVKPPTCTYDVGNNVL